MNGFLKWEINIVILPLFSISHLCIFKLIDSYISLTLYISAWFFNIFKCLVSWNLVVHTVQLDLWIKAICSAVGVMRSASAEICPLWLCDSMSSMLTWNKIPQRQPVRTVFSPSQGHCHLLLFVWLECSCRRECQLIYSCCLLYI